MKFASSISPVEALTVPTGARQDRNVLLLKAAKLRSEHRVPEALELLARIQTLHPGFSRTYQEQGHCHVLLRDAQAAISALREAVRLNPMLPASWDMLEQLYRLSGDKALALSAQQNLELLKQLPPELIMASSLMADGDNGPAETLLRDHLREDAANVGALRLLAQICAARSDFSEAGALLERALQIAPDYQEARFDFANILLEQRKHFQARQQIKLLLDAAPENRDYLKQYGMACIGLGDYEPLIALYERLLSDPSQSNADLAELRLWRANALKVVGRQQEAVADYQAALAAQPDAAVAWFSLANLKTYRFSDEEIGSMFAAEVRPDLPETERVYLCFALGKALEDRGDFAGSWDFYARGNAIRRSASSYRPQVAEACEQRTRAAFPAEFFAERTGWGLDDAAPIFILGLPRSGSTLIEQILASHSQVEGTHELTEISRYAGEICELDPDCRLPLDLGALGGITASDAHALGARYISETQAYRRLNKPYFIDKMPNNFWHIGLIHLILPKATIIDVRRDPMSCCFSNLKQLFGTINQEFTYGVDEIARYFRTYLNVMKHWHEVLPGRVITVHYEEVVEDLDGSTRQILQQIGLPFDPACVAFDKTKRSIRTPSSEQVRQPISRAGLTQWQNYAPWLTALQARLGDALTTYRS